jgi:Spx/MgsR family transcriptional regulator
MIKIYTYKQCSTCRKAMQHLAERCVEAKEIPIRDTPPTVAELKKMLDALDGDIKKLFNKSGQDYRALNLKDKLPTMTQAAALKLLSTNGNLVRRPFAFIGRNGVVGYDKETWDNALG